MNDKRMIFYIPGEGVSLERLLSDGDGTSKEKVYLPFLSIGDMPPGSEKRKDGSRVFDVYEKEWNAYIALNSLKESETKVQAIRSEIESCMELKAQAERQMPLPSHDEADAKSRYWAEMHGEDKDYWEPHFFSQEEYDDLCERLDELMETAERLFSQKESS